MRSLALPALVLALTCNAASAQTWLNSPVSRTQPGEAGNSSSASPYITFIGRYVAYNSGASNLVAGQVDPMETDVFLLDRQTNTTTLVSHAADDPLRSSSPGFSQVKGVAAAGVVLFDSTAPFLIAGETTGFVANTFLHSSVDGTNRLVSHAAGSTARSNGECRGRAMDLNGTIAVIACTGTNLQAGVTDTNGLHDLYLYRADTDTNTLITHAAGSPTVAANGGVDAFNSPVIMSFDGRYVAYTSRSTDLVAGGVDTNNAEDVFVYDAQTNTTRLVSHIAGDNADAGASGATLVGFQVGIVVFNSTNANHVPGATDTNGVSDVFRYRVEDQSIQLVTHAQGAPLTAANGASFAVPGELSSEEILVETTATNLIIGLSGAMTRDVMQWRSGTSTFKLVSHAAAGPTVRANAAARGVALNQQGARAVFETSATNIVPNFFAAPTNASNLYVFDNASGANQLMTHVHGQPAVGSARTVDLQSVRIDGPAALVVYTSLAGDLSASSDGNATADVYVHDYAANTSTLVSRAAFALPTAGDRQTTPVGMSGDGRYVLQTSNATNLAFDQIETDNDFDVFLYDRDTGTQRLVSHAIEGFEVRENVPANAASAARAISRDGNYVLFTSSATNLLAFQIDTNNNNDVFLAARTGGVSLVSHASNGNNVAANASAGAVAVSSDGQWVLWESNASNAVAGITDANGTTDVFLYDRLNGVSVVVSKTSGAATAANDQSRAIALTPDGRYVLYQSRATNLIAGFVNLNVNGDDVYLYDRVTATSRLVSREAGSAVRGASAGASAVGVSDDGDLVVFGSAAGNLVAGVAPAQGQAFVHRVSTSTTRLVSHTAASETGVPAAPATPIAISGDGSTVLFTTNAGDIVAGFADNNAASQDVYLHDTATRANALFSRAASGATQGSNREWLDVRINADATRIAFSTLASDVVAGVNAGAFWAQVYQHDRTTGTTTLISHRDGAAGEALRSSSGPVMSADGNRVAYSSDARNLVAWSDLNDTRDAFLAQRVDGYVVTPVVNGNGAIAPNGPQSVAPGGTVAFTLTPGVGQRIESAAGCGGALNGNQFTTAAVNADCTVTFTFAPQQFTLTYLAAQHGVIGGVATQTVNFGANGTQVTAIPDTGYAFDGWSDGLEFATRTDTNVMADLTVTASFTIRRFNLLYTAGAGGTIDGQAMRLFTVDYGADGPAVTAIPDAGKVFVRWSDGVATAQRTDLDVMAHLSVEAEFAMSQNFTVTPVVGANGTILPNGPQSVAPGGTTFFDVTPNAGYRVGSASGCNGTLAGNRYTTGPVNANCSVDFTFNRTPVAQDGTLDAVEDGGVYGGALGANDDDALTVVLVSAPAKGSLNLQGQNYFYAPNADANGTDTFTFRVNDGVQDSNVATVTITIAPVNDKPTFALSPGVVPEHPQGTSGAQTRNGILGNVDFGPADEDATQTVAGVQAFEIFDPSNILSNVGITTAGVLTYTLSGNAGLARVSVTLTDSGGTANGGQASSDPQQLTISVRNATDLQVSDTNGTASVSPGQAVVYEVLVANAGPYATTAAQLDVPVPAGLADVLWSCNTVQLASCPQANGAGAIVALPVDLPSTGVLRFLVTGNVSAASGATLTHGATIATTGSMQEVNAANNSATDADPVVAAGSFIFGSGFEEASRIDVDVPAASLLYPPL